MTSQQDTDFVKCIQGHCMHPEDPEVCWYERNWREICQTETDHDVINDILSARQDQALTSWKDKEVERAIEIHDLENAVERLDVQCSEGKCKNCDSKRPRLKEIQERLESLQSQGGK